MNDLAAGQAQAGRRPAAAPVTVAAVQMISGPDVGANLEQAQALVEQAAARGARLVVLPEYFGIIGMRDADKVAVRETPGSGPIQDFLCATARRLGIWLVGGSVPLQSASPDKVLNSCLAYDPAGRLAARYDKIHLFSFERGAERYRESKTIDAGSQVVAFDTPFGRIGLSICYDLRFPELYRAMGTPDIILVPAAFTETTGRAHWEVLLRARAIENLAYVIAAAQGGVHPNGRETHGHSMVIDPWGTVLDRLEKGPGLVLGQVEPQRLADVRAGLPALSHRTL